MVDIKSYRDLDVWTRGRKLVVLIYKLTQSFPKEEIYALTSQMRRASISVPSNIAEGHSRSGTKDYVHFVSIAIGSLAELETQVLLSEDLGYVASEDTRDIVSDITTLQRMLHSLRTSLKSKLSNS
jgi:four helix bundle protein